MNDESECVGGPCEDPLIDTSRIGLIPKDDNWKHRSSGMKCTTCMWFVIKVGNCNKMGRCRRHCPTMSGYPVVFTKDWCGDHKLDENKL